MRARWAIYVQNPFTLVLLPNSRRSRKTFHRVCRSASGDSLEKILAKIHQSCVWLRSQVQPEIPGVELKLTASLRLRSPLKQSFQPRF